METHINGSRNTRSFGSIPSTIGVGVKFGDVALVAVEIFRTVGAASGSGFMAIVPNFVAGPAALPGLGTNIGGNAPTSKVLKYPLLLKVFGYIIQAFNGTTPAFTLVETNPDDSGSVNLVTLNGGGGTFAFGATTAGTSLTAVKVLTADKKYKLTWNSPGDTTTGEAYYFIELVGSGIQRPNIPSTAATIGGS